jgi:hypothetical protein
MVDISLPGHITENLRALWLEQPAESQYRTQTFFPPHQRMELRAAEPGQRLDSFVHVQRREESSRRLTRFCRFDSHYAQYAGRMTGSVDRAPTGVFSRAPEGHKLRD